MILCNLFQILRLPMTIRRKTWRIPTEAAHGEKTAQSKNDSYEGLGLWANGDLGGSLWWSESCKGTRRKRSLSLFRSAATQDLWAGARGEIRGLPAGFMKFRSLWLRVLAGFVVGSLWLGALDVCVLCRLAVKLIC